MPTIKQRLVVERLLVNNGNFAKSMREAGYSENYSKNPQTLKAQPGFQEVYAEIGLTPGFISKALKDDIENKPGRRAQEISLAMDAMGMKKQEREAPQTHIVINVLDGKAQALREEYEAKLRDTFIDLLPESQEHD